MRQMTLQVPRGEGARIVEAAIRFDGANLSLSQAENADREAIDVVVVQMPNVNAGSFLASIESVPGLTATFVPSGVLTLQPPASEVPEKVQDVSHRSPIEVYLAGLQSIGSWRGFLGYAVAAGVVVWLGMFTNTIYLLVAAMLIAPFAGPAMNAAIGTARGDVSLLWHALLRYISALGVATVVAGVMSLVFRQEVATQQMAAIANISTAAFILPLAAGAAGALTLCQSERSSLVSGAAVGMLVAASLAPPAGLIGMATVIGDWSMVQSGLFLLALQLAGINLAGAIVFRLFGLAPEGVRYQRGRTPVVWASALLTIAGLTGLLFWQFGSPAPTLQRSTLEQRVRAVVLETVEGMSDVYLAETTVQFTRAQIPGQYTLLVTLHVQPRNGGVAGDDALRERITRAVQQAIARQQYNVTPLVDVTVLHPPSGNNQRVPGAGSGIRPAC